MYVLLIDILNSDVHWNKIGIIGGTSLLELMKGNTTLSKEIMCLSKYWKLLVCIVLINFCLIDFIIESSLRHNLDEGRDDDGQARQAENCWKCGGTGIYRHFLFIVNFQIVTQQNIIEIKIEAII